MRTLVGFVVISIVVVTAVQADETPASATADPAPSTTDELLSIDKEISARVQSVLEQAGQYAALGERDKAAALAASAKGHLTELESTYETYLEAHPDDARVHNLFGNVCADLLKDEQRALSHWEMAVELDPDYADAHNNIGTYWLHFGESGKAMERFRKAVKLDPTGADYHFNLGQAYYLFRYVAQEKYGWSLDEVFERAIEESRTGSELKPDDFKLAEDYAMTFFGAAGFGVTPDWDAARAAWNRCRTLAGNGGQEFTILLNMARVELRAGAPADVRKYAQEALALKPGNAVAQRLIELSEARNAKIPGAANSTTSE